MPFNKRTVEPVCLSRVQIPNEVPNELECVANHTLANIIRQLSSLSAHAQDVFDELINDVGHIFQRTEGLHGRIERLKQHITQLDANADEITIQDVNSRKPFVSVTRIDQQVVNRATMPRSLRLLYEQAEPAPALHLLNPYRDDGRDSMKFYTDPSFFFNLWMQSMMQFPTHQNGHRSGKHDRHRSPKGHQQQEQFHEQESIYATNPTSSSQARLIQQTVQEQQYRNPQELMRQRNGSDHTPQSNHRMQQPQPIYSASNQHALLQYANNSFDHRSNSVQYGSPNLSTNSSLREQQSMTMNVTTSTPEAAYHTHNGHHTHSPFHNQHNAMPPPPPLPSHLEPISHMLQYPTPRQTITRPTASPPPPPPPPPPPASAPSHNHGMATLATIAEFDSLPPPPADFMERSPSPPPPPPPPPPAPPMPSTIPPAPPLPTSTLQSLVMRPLSTNTPSQTKNSTDSSQQDDVSMTSEASIQDPRPYIRRDLHSDLLEEIKKGIQLNNRKKEEEKKAAVSTKTSALNVMAIMEQVAKYRRDKIRPQSESDNDDESSRWEDSD